MTSEALLLKDLIRAIIGKGSGGMAADVDVAMKEIARLKKEAGLYCAVVGEKKERNEEIIRRCLAGEKQVDLAKEFKISKGRISVIVGPAIWAQKEAKRAQESD